MYILAVEFPRFHQKGLEVNECTIAKTSHQLGFHPYDTQHIHRVTVTCCVWMSPLLCKGLCGDRQEASLQLGREAERAHPLSPHTDTLAGDIK